MRYAADHRTHRHDLTGLTVRAIGLILLIGFTLLQTFSAVKAQSQSSSCYTTGGGTLEICRGDGQAEGVFFTPRPCELAQNVQIMRLPAGHSAYRPIQVIYQAETPIRGLRNEDVCPSDRRATNPFDSGSVRTGGQFDQLTTIMPPSTYRLWETPREIITSDEGQRRNRRSRRWQDRTQVAAKTPINTGLEGIGARNPMVVAGRDWAGDEHFYAFLIAPVPVEGGVRHALIQTRTRDFEAFDIRSEVQEEASTPWTPFALPANKTKRRRGTPVSPIPSAVLDQNGKPIVGNCAHQPSAAQGLIGSVVLVNKVYHYFYTDVISADCGQPALKQRMGLYLRTSQDLNADRVWSAARTVTEKLASQSVVRVAKASGLDRWVVSYNCARPANVQGGPIDDICVQYTSSLSIGGLEELTWYEEPAAARRSNTYLGLRSGGDEIGRYERSQHFWMTDRYGNLDTPSSFTSKSGFLTWVDRLAPRQDGGNGSTIYGRPVYWGTWSVRTLAPKQ